MASTASSPATAKPWCRRTTATTAATANGAAAAMTASAAMKPPADRPPGGSCSSLGSDPPPISPQQDVETGREVPAPIGDGPGQLALAVEHDSWISALRHD